MTESKKESSKDDNEEILFKSMLKIMDYLKDNIEHLKKQYWQTGICPICPMMLDASKRLRN